MILLIGQLCRSDYEWYQHESVTRAVGTGEDMLATIAAEEFDVLPPRIHLAVAAADEMHAEGGMSGATFAAAKMLRSGPTRRTDDTDRLLPMTAGFLRSMAIEIDEVPLGDAVARA